MGASQSKPVTTKHSASDMDHRIYVGSSCMQGWRPYMEDFHTCILKMPNIAFPHHCPHPYVCTYSHFPKEAAALINEYLEASNVDIADDDASPISPTARPSPLNGHVDLTPQPPTSEDSPDAKPPPEDHSEPAAQSITMTRTPTGHITINSTLDLDLGSNSANGDPHIPITRVVSTYTPLSRSLSPAAEKSDTISAADAPTGPAQKPTMNRSATQITIPTHPPDVAELKNVHPPPYVFRTLLFPSEEHHSFFAVCDGHRGNRVAHYLSRRVHWRVASSDEFERGEYADAMRKGFVGLDEELKNAYETVLTGREPAGSTCVTALVTTDQQLYVANTGDSRAVLCSAGEVVPMSFDHKPDGQHERERIENAGGFVEDGRVLGRLATARAIGDFDFKRDADRRLEDQIVTAKPDVFHKTLTDDDEFLVMCSDGVFDVLSSSSLISFVRSRLAAGLTPPTVAGEVLDYCLATTPSVGDVQAGSAAGTDNMTCVIVVFLRGRTWEEYVEVVRRRYGGLASPAPDEDVVELDLSNLDENGDPKARPRTGSLGSNGSGSFPAPPIANPRKRYDQMGDVGGWQCCGVGPGTEPKDSPEGGSSKVAATKLDPIVRNVEEVELGIRQETPSV
ncbi:protein serine/threonine phosphatase 2C [Gonapodya prolifera JEL478]|uniref:protein-serine/threonine phosphatase n=1 Tax=Gonapodya prolifera (strain JEL478) TaxID=1344416 RepID=A0A139A9M2_GONPJ|nr:protein serine/threonine phosphatase 2C [Gonapodya prolifera JEL478]|eukprot:KXS13500.1 protein serine/threonine phosphatase 2C [Gonapodya prolifera JEL478]